MEQQQLTSPPKAPHGTKPAPEHQPDKSLTKASTPVKGVPVGPSGTLTRIDS